MKKLFELVSNIKKQEHRIKKINERKEEYTENEYELLRELLENNRPIRDKKLKKLYEILNEGGLV